MAEKRILVTGATGFIGSALVQALAARHEQVTVLVRTPEQVARFASPVRAVLWDPGALGDWCEVLSGQDAVVHLTGEQAVGVRWTESAKQRIEQSRVDITARLVSALGRAEPRPRVLVSGSAVGFYGDRPGSERLDETAPAGTDFLAGLCRRWEDAALGAEALGVRVVLARFGIVLDKGGGALEEMVKPFRLFAGGPIGSGEQVVSWVHRADAVGMLIRCVEDKAISGPVNIVAPEAVTQAELARAIGRTLDRPSWLRVPGVALRARFGEGAAPLLTGQRVVPGKMNAAGHVWHHPDLGGALAASLT